MSQTKTPEQLKQARSKIIKYLGDFHDVRKILSFLGNCAVVDIDDKTQTIYIGAPNQFVIEQIKKFFQADISTAIANIWGYKFGMEVDPASSELSIDIKKTLGRGDEQDISTAVAKMDNHTNKLLVKHFGIMFEDRYRFENFVVGSGNELAYHICLRVAQNPGGEHNPVFLWGNVGLGKTHLLQATANFIISKFPDKSVLYMPILRFVEEMIDSISKKKLNHFLKKFEGVDVLILDDIQFLEGKEKSQEILHNLFNEFVSHGKQIMISSDRPPKLLPLIESRLKSRFAMGMICDISMPDYETRVVIIRSKLQSVNFHLDDEYIYLIAKHISDNVREIEGIINTISAKQKLTGKIPTQDDILRTIKQLGYYINMQDNLTSSSHTDTNISKYDDIVLEICKQADISISDIKSDSKKQQISKARQQAMYIAKNDFGRTFERIGEYFGGKHYSTVMYAIDQYSKKLKRNI